MKNNMKTKLKCPLRNLLKINTKLMHFIHDKEKMKDFCNISKEEFLKSYNYLSEKDYEDTEDYIELNFTEIIRNKMTDKEFWKWTQS